MKEIRLLKKSEIRLRVGNFVESQYGVYVNLLAHTDARTCSKILDETFGVLGWQRGYQGINNELFCEVSVWDEDKKQWNKKSDVGAKANDGSTKGCASDAFKRACVGHGIARELYSLKNIGFKLESDEFFKKGETIKSNEQFFVSEIAYDEQNRTFTEFVVVDKNNKVRYRLSTKNQSAGGTEHNEPKLNSSQAVKPSQGNTDKGKHCQECRTVIPLNVATYSSKHFGRPLCFNCQQKHKAS